MEGWSRCSRFRSRDTLHSRCRTTASGIRSAELVRLYDTITDRHPRDRLIRMMADRGDAVSRDKLARIAAGDPNADLRERARRKLPQR